jgi:hypothetical protein
MTDAHDPFTQCPASVPRPSAVLCRTVLCYAQPVCLVRVPCCAVPFCAMLSQCASSECRAVLCCGKPACATASHAVCHVNVSCCDPWPAMTRSRVVSWPLSTLAHPRRGQPISARASCHGASLRGLRFVLLMTEHPPTAITSHCCCCCAGHGQVGWQDRSSGPHSSADAHERQLDRLAHAALRAQPRHGVPHGCPHSTANSSWL